MNIDKKTKKVLRILEVMVRDVEVPQTIREIMRKAQFNSKGFMVCLVRVLKRNGFVKSRQGVAGINKTKKLENLSFLELVIITDIVYGLYYNSIRVQEKALTECLHLEENVEKFERMRDDFMATCRVFV